MENVLYLMTVVLIISVADAGTIYKQKRSNENDQNQCLPNPCQNGGNFTNNNGDFTCTCADGYAGARCDKVPLELAKGKPVEQSSTFLTYSATLAVDGNRGTNVIAGLCASTGWNDLNPWWRVDLQAVYSITSVRILNRGPDQYADVSNRLRDVTVTVGLTESDVNTPCGFFAGPGTLSQLVVIECPALTQGRFVKISKTTEYLTMCEVEVFGFSESVRSTPPSNNAIDKSLADPCLNGGYLESNDGCFTCACAEGWTGALCNQALKELALNKPAKQSTTYYTYSANLAVDGNKGTDFFVDKCSCTNVGDLHPWLSVDLQAVYNISSVRIFNRGMDVAKIDVAARLRYVTVTVGLTESDVNTPCGYFAGPGTLSQMVDIDCPALPQGRFVKISAETEYLTLCEVQVFGFSG